MAKIMVMIDIPDIEYDELKRAMDNWDYTKPNRADFSRPGRVAVHPWFVNPLKQCDGWYQFKLIGVKP